MISSLKIKLNCSWKFWRNWNVPLVMLKRSWWAGFNGIYLVRFGFRMWGEILIFKWFLPLKIQINSPKNQVLEGKISWGHGNAWANGTGHTSSHNNIIVDNCRSWENNKLNFWKKKSFFLKKINYSFCQCGSWP
jgi:hypothetical protein